MITFANHCQTFSKAMLCMLSNITFIKISYTNHATKKSIHLYVCYKNTITKCWSLIFLDKTPDERSRKATLEDRSGYKKRKGSGGRDDRHPSVEIRINPSNSKRVSSSTRQLTNFSNKNTNTPYRKKTSDSGLKPSKMRDGEERTPKPSSPGGGSRAASPEPGRSKYGKNFFLFRGIS